MFLNQPFQQNVKKTATKDFCNGWFTASVTAFGKAAPIFSTVFPFIIYILKIYITQNSSGCSRNPLLKKKTIMKRAIFQELKTRIENKKIENLRFLS